MARTVMSILSLLMGFLPPLAAHAAGDHARPPSTQSKTTESSGPMSEGEIRKIDRDAAKVTIKHGELKNLDMPPMTMVFRAKNTTLLDNVKVGDTVNFVAEKEGGYLTVTKIEPKNTAQPRR